MVDTKREILLTVRCLTYNHAPYIRQCLESIVTQKTNFAFKILVHDDASTDGTTDIVREFAARYPDIIETNIKKENLYSHDYRKFQHTIYSGFEGKYVAWCDGDDYWCDEYKLQKQVDFLESNQQYMLVCSNAKTVDKDDKEVYRNRTRRLGENAASDLVCGCNPIISSSACFRRELISDYTKLIPEMPFEAKMGDYPLWIFISLRGQIYQFDENLVAYRVLNSSASHSRDVAYITGFRNSSQELALWFNAHYNIGVSERKIKHAFSRIRLRELSEFDRATYWGEYKNAVKNNWQIIFNPKLLVITIIRMLLNMRVSSFVERLR